jgi:hypothetical protein
MLDHDDDERDALRETLYQLRHEIGGDLSVITMGLETLFGLRDRPDEFAEVLSMMRQNAERLKVHVAELAETSALCVALHAVEPRPVGSAR